MWKATRPRFVFLWLWLCFCSSAASPPGLLAEIDKPEPLYDKSQALIIGIEQYAQAPSVPGAVEEAKQVAQAVRQLGFEEIIELYNKDATSRRLQQALTDVFTRKVGRTGRVVLFFAGHTGTTRSNGRDVGYLVPTDVQVNNVAKSITVETLKDFSRRSPSRHTVMIIDAPLRAGEAAAPPKPLSPEGDTEARAVQVISAADKGDKSAKGGGRKLFVQTLVTGLSGAADLNQNGWLTASELGIYLKQQVEAVSLRIDGDGDTVLIQARKTDPVLETNRQSPKDREAAKSEYEQALALLQGGKYAEEALVRLNRALEYDSTFTEAYLLKSYLRLEVIPQLDEALAAGQQAVQHAPDNADAYYNLGLVHEKMGHYREAETAFVQTAKLNPDHQDVYFTLGTLYEDQLSDNAKSVEAFRRYLQLGGAHARARAAVSQADQAASSPADASP